MYSKGCLRCGRMFDKSLTRCPYCDKSKASNSTFNQKPQIKIAPTRQEVSESPFVGSRPLSSPKLASRKEEKPEVLKVIVVKKKSALGAGILECIIPGLGMIYAGAVGLGLSVLVGTLIASCAISGFISNLYIQADRAAVIWHATSNGECCVADYLHPDYSTADALKVLFVMFLLTWLGIRIYLAVRQANRNNEGLRGSTKVEEVR